MAKQIFSVLCKKLLLRFVLLQNCYAVTRFAFPPPQAGFDDPSWPRSPI